MRSSDGLIRIDITPGRHQVPFTYRPPISVRGIDGECCLLGDGNHLADLDDDAASDSRLSVTTAVISGSLQNMSPFTATPRPQPPWNRASPLDGRVRRFIEIADDNPRG
jgi:hypothetical protein